MSNEELEERLETFDNEFASLLAATDRTPVSTKKFLETLEHNLDAIMEKREHDELQPE